MDYCAPSDVYDFGIPRGAVPNSGRLVASADVTSNALTLDVHGFDLNAPVVVRADAGGSLPAPLAEGVTYYAIPRTESTFALAATVDGSAIDLTTAGENIVVVAPMPIGPAITWASRYLDDFMPAHVVPMTAPVPPIIKMAAAELAAWKLTGRSGATSIALSKMIDDLKKRIDRWAAGVPIRGENEQPPANLSVSASATGCDPDGWRRYGGL